MEDAGGGGPPANSRESSLERKKQRTTRTSNQLKGSKPGKSCSDLPSPSVNSFNDRNQSERRYDNKYDSSHKGPFMVYVDTYDASGLRKFLSGITVSRILTNLKTPDVLEVIKIGYGRCKVLFKKFEAANDFVDDARLKELGLLPKIFEHFVSKIAIVYDIPLDISMEELKEELVSPCEIVRCFRVTRRIKDTNEEMKITETKNVKIVFKGNEIPKEVIFGYVKIPVKHFIAFGQCYRCYRFNHFAQHCKQNFELCRSCYHQHGNETGCVKIICTNCKGDHSPTDKNCPAREKAFAIKKLMVIENLSIKEASLRFKGVFSNRFAELENDSPEFPPLRQSQTRQSMVNNHIAAAKAIHDVVPYAKVVKQNKNKRREELIASNTMALHRQLNNENVIKFSHNKPAFKSPSGTVSNSSSKNPLFISQEMDNNREVARECLNKISKDTTEFLANMKNGDYNRSSITQLVTSLHENANRSINYLDAESISRSISMESFY